MKSSSLGVRTALEGRGVAVGGEAQGVPEAHGRLHAQLSLEGPQRRVGVVGPIAPSGAGEAILTRESGPKRAFSKPHSLFSELST